MAQTLKEKILQELENGSQTDRELTDKLCGYGEPPQSVNQTCRELRDRGYIKRSERPIRNSLAEKEYFHSDKTVVDRTKRVSVSKDSTADKNSTICEESLKKCLNDWLIANGWETTVAWGKQHGIDIDAKRNNEHWIIEVKGNGSRNAMRVNYFLGILGELLQHMHDPHTRYSIALPDLKQYRNIWARLPALAKQRTTIDAIFVSETGILNFTE